MERPCWDSWGTSIFQRHFPKIQSVFILLMLGIGGNVHDPPKPIILEFGPTKLFQMIQGKTCSEHAFRNLSIVKIENVGKTRADKSLRSVLSILGNLEYGINIFQKT